MAHTAEDDRCPMEGTEDNVGREGFKKRNAGEWTNGRQNKIKQKQGFRPGEHIPYPPPPLLLFISTCKWFHVGFFPREK